MILNGINSIKRCQELPRGIKLYQEISRGINSVKRYMNIIISSELGVSRKIKSIKDIKSKRISKVKKYQKYL